MLKNRKKNRRKKRFLVCIIVLLILVVSYIFLVFNVNPIIYSVSEAQVRALSAKAVNNAVSEVVSSNNIYNDLVNISTDMYGNITMISANSIQINYLTKELIKISQHKIEKIGVDGVKIPIGTFTGLPIFTGVGPKIKIRIIPVGSMSCNFESQFISAGINQTNHKIYVNIESDVNVVLPVEQRKVSTLTQILICESIIVGKVPEVYFNGLNTDGSIFN